ncbi:MAG: DNA cytosine methyltransferase [Amaricoccus sp.]
MALHAAGVLPGGDGDALLGLSLCAGVGGLDLGLVLACPGYRTVGYVEREAFAAALLVARMEDAALDHAPVWDDVAGFDGGPWRGGVDIVLAGYPCQPFSVAGRRLAAADPRHLWPHVARIVGEVAPPFVFLENVAHHLRLGFPEVAGDLVGLGYRLAAGLFTAAEVGAPHRRERLFVLAARDGDPEADPGRLLADPARRRQQGDPEPHQRPDWRDGEPPRRGDALRCGVDLADAADRQLPEPRRRAEAREGPRPDGAGLDAGGGVNAGAGGDVDDADGAGPQGRRDEPREHAGERPAWPPGPGDAAGWERYLRSAPELEPAVRRGADGLAFRVDLPALFGTSAATLESDVVWGIFTSNPAMADGTTLFHASHKNLAGAGAALDVAGLAKARTAMAQQRGLDGKTLLNVRPSYLVVPSALELAAEQLLAQNIVPAKAADVVPSSIRSLAVIAEPRLDPASGAVPWFLVASPAAIDTVEYAYLEGQEGVAAAGAAAKAGSHARGAPHPRWLPAARW